MTKKIKVRLYIEGYADVEMFESDHSELIDRLEEDGEVDIDEVPGIIVSDVLDTCDLNVTDA